RVGGGVEQAFCPRPCGPVSPNENTPWEFYGGVRGGPAASTSLKNVGSKLASREEVEAIHRCVPAGPGSQSATGKDLVCCHRAGLPVQTLDPQPCGTSRPACSARCVS